MNDYPADISRWKALHQQIVAWREQYITDWQFTLILSFMVGVLASFAGWVLHLLIHEIQHLLTMGFNVASFNWLLLVYPVVGIWLTSVFIKYVVRDNISHGITRILYAISTKSSRLKGHNTWTSVVASAITIGFGGSVGAEAPIVLTGSAIGSNLGRFFRMDNRTLMLLVGCGAAAAIAGVFKAPIAGLVFTMEVLMIDLTMVSLVPILISSVTATCLTFLFSGGDQLFHFQLDSEWNLARVPAYILLGVFGGVVSLHFMRSLSSFEGVFGKLSDHRYAKLLLGAVTLSVLIFLFPSLYGEGYSSINVLLGGKTTADWNSLLDNSLFYGQASMLIPYVALVLFTKVFATAATNGGGGCGGTFAPSLFVGAFAGFLFARLWNMYEVGVYVPEANFALLGMAGVMAGVMHAPLTGIFLIAELTGGYQLFIPLMIVALSSYLFVNIFEKHGIYSKRLARQGKLLTHHTDKAVLTLMSLESIIDRQFTFVEPDMRLGKLVHRFADASNTILPVLNPDGALLGEIDLARIRHVVFRTELYNHFTVSQLMADPPATLFVTESMDEVMAKFDATSAQMLPVIGTDLRLTGYVDRAHMLAMYRQMVADLSRE